MSFAQLMFFFIMLPLFYSALFLVLASFMCSYIKQIKQDEYTARLKYDQEKMKLGQEVAAQLRPVTDFVKR